MAEITVEKLASAGVVTLPWPTAVGGTILSNTEVPAHLLCAKCPNRECLSSLGTVPAVTARVCRFGVSYYKAQVGEEEITVYGVFDRERTDKKAKEIKRALSRKGQKITQPMVAEWVTKIPAIKKAVAGIVVESGKMAGREVRDQILHDAPIMVGRAKAALDKFMQENPHSVTSEIKTAHKSVRMASDTFVVVEILLNPESASYGNKREIEIYKLLDGIRISANMDRWAVELQGTTHRKVKVHDSFGLLPLMLVQNAVKYNSGGNPVFLEVEELDDGVKIAVKSYGPAIEDAEKIRIFERNFRGKWAKIHTSQRPQWMGHGRKSMDGRGLGLYVAHVIAEAHGAQIHVRSTPDGTSKYDVPMANNTFSFVLKSGKG